MSDILKNLGSLAGGAIGTAIAPGIGTAIGSKLGGELSGLVAGDTPASGGADSSNGVAGALGVGQLIASALKKNKANGLQPEADDIEQRNFLNEINRKRKAINTGAAYQEQMGELKNQQASTINGMLSASGGAGGAAIAGMARAGRGTSSAFANILAQGDQKEMALTQMSDDLIQRMSGRRLDLQNYEYTRALGEAAKLEQGGMGNTLAAHAQTTPIDDGRSGGVNDLLQRLFNKKTNNTGISPDGELDPGNLI